MPVVTISDYQDNTGLPGGGAARSFRDRTCPNLITWWSFSWDAYRLEPLLERPMFVRRLCMWIVLLLRVLMGVLAFGMYANSLRIEMMVLSPILTMLDFFFLGFCLAHIGQSEGKRRVLAVMVGRWHFDVFLVFCAVSHVLLVVEYFIWSGAWLRGSVTTVWWILIVATAWVASWPAEIDDTPEGEVNLV